MAARPCIRCGKPNYGWRQRDFCVICRRPEYSSGYAPEIARLLEKGEAVHTEPLAPEQGLYGREQERKKRRGKPRGD